MRDYAASILGSRPSVSRRTRRPLRNYPPPYWPGMIGYLTGLIGLAGAHAEGWDDWTDYAFSGVGFAMVLVATIWQIRRHARHARQEPYLG